MRLGLGGAVVAAAAAGTGGAAFLLSELFPARLPPPLMPNLSILDTLVYTRFPTDQWWNAKADSPVRVGDFELWAGATAVWRGLFDDFGTLIPGTGYPVLVIRVPRVDTYYELPSPLPWTLDNGFALTYDDPVRDIRIVAGFDRCTHLCCFPGWHVVTNPPVPHDYSSYGTSPPTYDVYGLDPIYCICHDAQYDPLVLVADTNPHNGVRFPGLQIVHPPGTFAMPLVPLRAVNDVLEGGLFDPRWYVYC